MSTGILFRLLIGVLGITTMMAGAALVTLAGLGTPPVSAPVWVSALAGALSFGGWMLVFNLCFVAGN